MAQSDRVLWYPSTPQVVQAREILKKVRVLDPTAIVAGGAPRDFVMGRVAKDIDIFVYWRPDLCLSAFSEAMEAVGIELQSSVYSDIAASEHSEMYATNPDIRTVYNVKGGETPTQIILCDKPTFGMVEKFPLSICQVWTGVKDLEGMADSASRAYSSAVISEEFAFGQRHTAIFKTNSAYSGSENYIKKIRGYFPDYKYVDLTKGN